MLKILFYFFYKASYLNEEVNCTKPSPSVSIPWPKSNEIVLSFLSILSLIINIYGANNVHLYGNGLKYDTNDILKVCLVNFYC